MDTIDFASIPKVVQEGFGESRLRLHDVNIDLYQIKQKATVMVRCLLLYNGI